MGETLESGILEQDLDSQINWPVIRNAVSLGFAMMNLQRKVTSNMCGWIHNAAPVVRKLCQQQTVLPADAIKTCDLKKASESQRYWASVWVSVWASAWATDTKVENFQPFNLKNFRWSPGIDLLPFISCPIADSATSVRSMGPSHQLNLLFCRHRPLSELLSTGKFSSSNG